MAHILIIEDEENIRTGLKDLLETDHYQVSVAEDGKKGLSLALKNEVDLIILDIMLPHLDGYEILKVIRSANLETPVILLSAKTQELDRVLGFRLGADDYVTKPFSSSELLMRVKARLKSPQNDKLRSFRSGELMLDMVASKLCIGDKEVNATIKEKEILSYLIRHAGKAVTRQQILKEVWGPDASSVTSRTVDTHILTLRKKIEPNPKKPTFIVSVHNVGYRFEKADSSS
ncbi:MAG: response regulator transcription factor [Candidatus Brocadiales bacterium]|nr:response regulator transcription factor [Candidatus Brocadiales bacterium]